MLGVSTSSARSVDDKAESLHHHATERVERLRVLLHRLEAEGGSGDPILDAVRTLLDEAQSTEPEPPRNRPR